MIEKKRGKLIVIEGTDCSGKETQTVLLVERLERERIPITTISFPTYGSPSGDIVGECYLGKSLRHGGGSWFGEADKVDPKVASLYYAADRRNFLQKINQILNSGVNLIIDRYYMSNMAHQGGKWSQKEDREKIFEWIEKLELGFLELPKEDVTIFLYIPTDVAVGLKKRRVDSGISVRDGHETNIDHLRRAEIAYLELVERYKWEKIDCAPSGNIESLRTREDIHEEIYRKIKGALGI